MRIDVREPENDGRGDDDGNELPEIVLERPSSGGDDGEDDDRAVDRARDRRPGPEDKPPDHLDLAHGGIIRQR